MKCEICKKEIDHLFFAYESKNIYFCSEQCLLKYAKEKENGEEYNKLVTYLLNKFHCIEVPNRIFAEIKRFHDKEGLSYHNILAICHYMFDVAQESTNYISIYKVPQYKEEAKKWYIENDKKRLQAEKLTETVKERKINLNNNNSIRKRNIVSINPNEI